MGFAEVASLEETRIAIVVNVSSVKGGCAKLTLIAKLFERILSELSAAGLFVLGAHLGFYGGTGNYRGT